MSTTPSIIAMTSDSTSVMPETETLQELSIYSAQTTKERQDALKLISDSVAQMRQTVNRSIFFHPLTLPPYIAFLSALVYRAQDPVLTLLFLVGITIATMSLCGRFTEPFLERAEAVGSDAGYEEYVAEKGGREVVVARWGGEIIGAVSVDMKKGKAGEAIVKAWTVRLRYRRKGLGRDLLEKAVEIARARLGDNCTVRFAEDHANSYRHPKMPKTFQKVLDERETQAREVLAEILRPQSS
ncbi:hypothetical protein RUND412_002101 [Rhizina undulata]